jgi:anthranilate phosphoribosyltransferase
LVFFKSMDPQHTLEELLRKKGIGPQGSKSLKAQELAELNELMLDKSVSLTTRATMLTALLTLEPNEDEKIWLEKIKARPEENIPSELTQFINESGEGLISYIRKIISLKELSPDECKLCMDFFFDVNVPEYLKAPFLEAERLKRESFAENQAFFESLWKRVKHIELNTPVLIDICDSYDGANRTRIFSPFIAALLASCGYTTYLHGLDKVAPKQGVTAHQVLKYAGKNSLKSAEAVKKDLENPEVRWGYIDQQVFFPELHAMKNMRKEMVKRPFLATFEKLLQPFQAKGGNYIVTGYTHPHYKDELVAQLKHQQQCCAALVLKGAEGATQLSLGKDTVYVLYNGADVTDGTINPSLYGLENLEAKQDKSLSAKESAEEGLAALKGEKNYARENMLYTACAILDKMKLSPPDSSLQLLRKNLDSGKALEHWEKS